MGSLNERGMEPTENKVVVPPRRTNVPYPLVSVIVPVYNVEKYLPDCLRSIFRQTYQNLEIILVDDGSTDSSGEICDRAAGEDDRVRVIHQKNQGVSAARNAALDIASGEYITFVDSDDFVSPYHVETAYRVLLESGADITIGGFQLVPEEAHVSTEPDCAEVSYTLLQTRDALERVLAKRLALYAWSNFYKLELLDNIRFPVNKVHEERPFVCGAMVNAKQVAFINDSQHPRYFYRQRKGSIMHSPSFQRYCNQMETVEMATDIIAPKFPELSKQCVLLRARAYFNLLNVFLTNGQSNQHSREYEELIEKINAVQKSFSVCSPMPVRLRIESVCWRLGMPVYHLLFYATRVILFVRRLTIRKILTRSEYNVPSQ